MYEATRRQGAAQSPRRCHKEYGAEVSGGDCGKPALLWAFTGEIVNGYQGVVCTKVGHDEILKWGIWLMMELGILRMWRS